MKEILRKLDASNQNNQEDYGVSNDGDDDDGDLKMMLSLGSSMIAKGMNESSGGEKKHKEEEGLFCQKIGVERSRFKSILWYFQYILCYNRRRRWSQFCRLVRVPRLLLLLLQPAVIVSTQETSIRICNSEMHDPCSSRLQQQQFASPSSDWFSLLLQVFCAASQHYHFSTAYHPL